MTQTLTNRYNQCLYNEHPLVQQLHGLPAGSPDATHLMKQAVNRFRQIPMQTRPEVETDHLGGFSKLWHKSPVTDGPSGKNSTPFPTRNDAPKNHKCGAIPRWCEIAPGESWRKRKKTYIWTKYPVILNEKISTSIRVTTNQCLFPGSLNRWKEAYNLPEGKDYKW